jgi:hypothetical protein
MKRVVLLKIAKTNNSNMSFFLVLPSALTLKIIYVSSLTLMMGYVWDQGQKIM